MNKINKQNSNRLIDAENRLTAVRGEREGLLGEIDEEIKQKNTSGHRHYEREGGGGG